jgi:hypothetical protein
MCRTRCGRSARSTRLHPYSFLVAPLSRKRNVLRAERGIVNDRQVGGTCTRGAGRERDRNDAIVGGRKRTGARIGLRIVALVCAGDADAADIQRGCAGVGEGHVFRAAVADHHRPEVQAARVVAGLGIDHGRRQADLLRASRSVVVDVDCGGKGTNVAGKEDYVDNATLPRRRS